LRRVSPGVRRTLEALLTTMAEEPNQAVLLLSPAQQMLNVNENRQR
jgi:hypothetical protein